VVGLPDDVEGLFRTFMDQSPLTAWIVDDEDRLVYSSEPFPLRDDQVGMSMWDMVPEPYVRPYREALHRARTTGETQVVSAPGPVAGAAPGAEGWFQAYYFSLPEHWVGGVGLDVTNLTEAREELERSRQRLVAAGDEARRHAQATTAEVSVQLEGNALVTVVSDDGVGGVVVQRGGGLEGLRDRIQALGGSLEISSPSGAGTTLRATIPLRGPLGSDASNPH
jgi:hypothetical protein